MTRAYAVTANFRTLMAHLSASGETYDKRAKLRLRRGEWGDDIFGAKDVLWECKTDMPEWERGEYEDFSGLA